MLKRILLALDVTPASASAQNHALTLAANEGAAITGLVLVDPDLVSPAEPVPLGADAYKQHKDSMLLQKAVADAEAVSQRFRAECLARKVACEARVVQGKALAELVAASAQCDIIAIGVDASFEAAAPCNVSETVTRLLRDNSRPVLLTPPQSKSEGTAGTLIAYDGSIAAMRAVQLFALMQINAGLPAIVASVNCDNAVADGLCETAAAYLREHGYEARTEPLAAEGNIAESLLKAAERAHVSMIVAGAYGEQQWKEWLMGSTTRHLLEKTTIPLFIHH